MGFQGKLLRGLRLQHGLTQRELAILVERVTFERCSRSTVTMWETADCTPSPNNLRALSTILQTPINDFLDGVHPTLKSLRTVAGFTQGGISKLLRVTTSTYADVETGRQRIPPRWVPVLAQAFRVDALTITTAKRDRPTGKRTSRQIDGATEQAG